MKQQSFSSLEQAHKKKRTKREVFLAEMESVVPWERLEMLIGPYYTKPRKGRPQMPLSVMLRIYFLQQWYGLSDPGAEEGLYDMHSMRDFVGVDLVHDVIQDETNATLVACDAADACDMEKAFAAADALGEPLEIAVYNRPEFAVA